MFFFALVTLFTVLPFLSSAALAAPHSHRGLAKARRAFDLSSRGIATFLDAHNDVRAKYNAQPLTWSPTLATKAAFWADLCMFQPSDGILNDRPYGETIVAATGKFTIRDAIGTLAATKDQFDPKTSYSQFTQIVWKSTTQVGCAIATCEGIIERPVTLYVCVYDPAGNIVGELPENVQI